MPVDISLISAFLVGLLGGVHCAGMCGGIVGAFSLHLPTAGGRRFVYQLAYNLGRVLTYTLAGALVGAGGAALADLYAAQFLLALFAALFMLALGLYLGGWWQGLTRVEAGGRYLWRYLEPLGRRFLPPASPPAALALGLVWGWLPCGLVYSVLIWSMSAGSAASGALLMFAFALGTLPNLLAMGVVAGSLGPWLQRPRVRQGAGLLVMLFALLMLVRLWRQGVAG